MQAVARMNAAKLMRRGLGRKERWGCISRGGFGVRVLAQVEAGGIELTCDQPVQLRAEGDRWFVSPIAADSVQRQGVQS